MFANVHTTLKDFSGTLLKNLKHWPQNGGRKVLTIDEQSNGILGRQTVADLLRRRRHT